MKKLAVSLAGILLLAACAAGPEPTPATTRTPEPVQTAPPSPTPEPPGPAVKTDWSKLEPREKLAAVGRRWYAVYTDRLAPLDYGGDLIPYAGLRLMDDWPAADGGGCLYGLMTLGGAVVVDPVYSRVARLDWNQWWESEADKVLPILGLCIGRQSDVGDGWTQDFWAFAGANGAWATEHKYHDYACSPEGVFAYSDQGCDVLGLDGALLGSWAWEELGYAQKNIPPFSRTGDYDLVEWLDGLVLLEQNEEQARVLDTATGEVSTLDRGTWEAKRDGAGYGRADGHLDPYSGSIYHRQGDQFSDAMGLLDADGRELARIGRPGWYSSLKLVGGLVERVDRDWATYTDLEGNVVFRCKLGLGEE